MQRGEVWWADFGERRPVVLLSGDTGSGFRAMQVVDPAGTDLGGLGIEVAVPGLPFDGVLRFAFPRPGFLPCTWITTLYGDDLIERASVLSEAKTAEIDDAVHLAEQEREWTPETIERARQIADALRRQRPGTGR
jgi:mRNA interferase MazF